MGIAKVYYNRLLLGTITFDAIQPKYQNAVRDLGKADVRSGKLLVEEYEMLFKEPYEA